MSDSTAKLVPDFSLRPNERECLEAVSRSPGVPFCLSPCMAFTASFMLRHGLLVIDAAQGGYRLTAEGQECLEASQ